MTPPMKGFGELEITTPEQAEQLVDNLTEEERKQLFEALKKKMGDQEEKKESITKELESPRKALEKERKTAAIVELERLGMKTNENVEKINAIQFLDDKIFIGNTPWAYENMAGGQGMFKKETNKYYYNFAERKAEAKNQGIVLPKKEDIVNTLKALPGQYSGSNYYDGGNILSIILGESLSGYCDSDGFLYNDGEHSYLGSISEYDRESTWNFGFNRARGGLGGCGNNFRIVCRPLVKK